jgi:1-acyl-sn-glycerol-3-phosphate acyltransferase
VRYEHPVAALTNEEAHRVARERGVSRWLYRLFRVIVGPLVRLLYGLTVTGVENIPATGAAIIAPNHKSFFDSFVIAVGIPRPVRSIGKAELFHGWRGRVFLGLGGFPVRRGESDAEALETARTVLRNGDLLVMFPEGTRVRDPDALGSPKRGAARLALEIGVPLIPTAISGTEKRRIPRPRRVQVSFGAPIDVSADAATPERAGDLLDEQLWPVVEGEFRRLRAAPGLVAVGLAAVGIGLAVRKRRGH